MLVKKPSAVSKDQTAYDPTPMTVVGKKGSMITAESENRIVTRNSSFFKTLNHSAISQGSDEFYNSGSGTIAIRESIQESPAVETPTLSAPYSAPPKLMNTPPSRTDLSNSSNPDTESQTRLSHPDSQQPLRRSTRKRAPRKILDL